MRAGTSGLALVLVLLAGVPAAAQDGGGDEDLARGHFHLGRAHFEAGRFADAAREFQQAYDISRRAALLYNVFLSHRDAGNLGAAIGALRQYLAEEQNIENRAALEQRLRTMEELHARQGDRPPDGATPPPDPDEGFDRTLPDPIGEEPRDEPEAGSWIPGWIIAAGGGALIAGGVVTGILTLGAQSDLDDRCPMRECTGDWEADRDSGQTLALVTDVLLIGGLAVAATGAILALTLGGDGEAEPEPASVACGLGGCTLEARF